MGYENIIAGDGFGVAIVGLSIVFTALIFISLFVAALPRVLGWAGEQGRRRREQGTARVKKTEGAAEAARENGTDEALRAAIAYVIRMELEQDNVLDNQRITIQRDQTQRTWAVVGKMRTLSTRL